MSATQLVHRIDARCLDLLDVALANEMLAVAGLRPLRSVAAGSADVVTVSADDAQAQMLRVMGFGTDMESTEAWMLSLAPRLVAGVLALVGEEWAAEAELGVELALSLRADDMWDFADRLEAGTVRVDGSLSSAAVIADSVPDPNMIHFL